MKNYIKVTIMGKNVEFFTFEDTDELAVERAMSKARDLVSRLPGTRIVAWKATGHVPKHLPLVGEVPS